MEKKDMIREIILAVNANHERTKDTQYATKKADGDLFFSLAFRTEKELINICKQIGIKL